MAGGGRSPPACGRRRLPVVRAAAGEHERRRALRSHAGACAQGSQRRQSRPARAAEAVADDRRPERRNATVAPVRPERRADLGGAQPARGADRDRDRLRGAGRQGRDRDGQLRARCFVPEVSPPVSLTASVPAAVAAVPVERTSRRSFAAAPRRIRFGVDAQRSARSGWRRGRRRRRRWASAWRGRHHRLRSVGRRVALRRDLVLGHHPVVLVLEHVAVEDELADVVGEAQLTRTVSPGSRRTVSLRPCSHGGGGARCGSATWKSVPWMWTTWVPLPPSEGPGLGGVQLRLGVDARVVERSCRRCPTCDRRRTRRSASRTCARASTRRGPAAARSAAAPTSRRRGPGRRSKRRTSVAVGAQHHAAAEGAGEVDDDLGPLRRAERRPRRAGPGPAAGRSRSRSGSSSRRRSARRL